MLVLGGCGESQTAPEPRDSGAIATVGGTPIHFEISGQGPPVALIHGASGNLRDWTFRAAPLIARNHTVIAFDRPGHGLSGLPERGGNDIAAQASLMRKALAQAGFDRATIAGHSYGGSVALAWALDAPQSVAGLLLLAAPSHGWAGGTGILNDLLANPLSGPALSRAMPSLATPDFVQSNLNKVFAPQAPPEGYIEHLNLDLVLQRASLRANARQMTALKDQVLAMVPRYDTLEMPLEIVHGTADPTVSFEHQSQRLATRLPHARLTRLDGIGHMPHQVATGQVVAALNRLTEGVRP